MCTHTHTHAYTKIIRVVHGSRQEVWLIYLMTLTWRKLIFTFPSSISGNSCLFESGTLCPLPLLNGGNLSGLTLCSPTHNVTVSASSCVPTPCWIWKKLFPWSCPSPLVLTLFLPPLQHPTPNLDGEDLTMTFHSRVSTPHAKTALHTDCGF